MSREIEAYLKQIERGLFTCPKKKRAAFLRDFRGNLNTYIEEHPNASVQELQSIFGTPEAIAEGFLQSDEFTTTKKVVSSKKRIVRILIAAVCALVVAAIVLGAVYVVDNHKFTHGYYEETPGQVGHSTPDPDALESY